MRERKTPGSVCLGSLLLPSAHNRAPISSSLWQPYYYIAFSDFSRGLAFRILYFYNELVEKTLANFFYFSDTRSGAHQPTGRRLHQRPSASHRDPAPDRRTCRQWNAAVYDQPATPRVAWVRQQNIEQVSLVACSLGSPVVALVALVALW